MKGPQQKSGVTFGNKLLRFAVKKEKEDKANKEDVTFSDRVHKRKYEYPCPVPVLGPSVSSSHKPLANCYVDVRFMGRMEQYAYNEDSDSDGDLADITFNMGYDDEDDDDDEVVFRNQSVPSFYAESDHDELPDNMQISVLDCIGQGLTSTVYSANVLSEGGERLKGTVAVKVFNKSTAYSVISSEVRFLRKLDHPHIITFVGYLVSPILYETPTPTPKLLTPSKINATPNKAQHSTKNSHAKPKPESRAFQETSQLVPQTDSPTLLGVHQLVMEHCALGSLFEILHQPRGDSRVPLAHIARKLRHKIILGTVKGMAYLHKCGIVHRDLSSKNILLGQNGEPKIADLGLAKLVPSREVDGTRIYDGQLTGMAGFGTDAWRAPEIWGKRKQVSYTQKIDVYSFAIILWELFHLGHVPWEGILDLEVAVQRGKRPRVSRESCPAAWEALMSKCWEHNEGDRFSFDDALNSVYVNYKIAKKKP